MKTDKNNELTTTNNKPKPIKKRKKGRPKGAIKDIIPIWKQEWAFQVWLETESIKDVARICGISRGSVIKYRERNNWAERKEIIQQKLQTQVDENIKNVKADMIMELTLLRRKALDQALKLGYKTAKDATGIFLDLLKTELSLRGEILDKRVNLLVIAAQRFKDRGVDISERIRTAKETGFEVDPENNEIREKLENEPKRK